MSAPEEELALHLQAMKLPAPEREFKFHDQRKWRFDFAWPAWKLAVEVEGGVHSRGRHTRGKGFEEDCRKYASAMVDGWRVLRVTPSMVRSGEALSLIENLLQ